MPMFWWGNPPQHFTDRMKAEMLAMQEAFPSGKEQPGERLFDTGVSWDEPFRVQILSRKLNIRENPAEPYWTIRIRFINERGAFIRSGDEFEIRITYKPGFPEVEPWPTLPSHDISDAPHRYTNHSDVICLHGHYDIRSQEWDPARSTAATLAVWSVQWIRAWLYWKRTHNWPDAA